MTNHNNTSSIVRISHVIGKPVVNENNELLGVIEDIVLGQINGTVRYVVLAKAKHVENLCAIPWGLLNYHLENNTFQLMLSKEALSKMPMFDKSHYPQFIPLGYTDSQLKDGLDLSVKQKIDKDAVAKKEQEKFIAEGGDSQPFGVANNTNSRC